MPWRRLVIGALAALLSACASMPPEPVGSAPPTFILPEQMDVWSANGQFSFRGPENRESGQFFWSQNDQDYLLRLIGPLGVGSAEVERTAGRVTIRSRGESYQGEVTDALLYELTGIWVPLDQLSDILLGQDDSAAHSWQISYSGVVEIDRYRLPQRLVLTSGDLVLQIFISRWTI